MCISDPMDCCATTKKGMKNGMRVVLAGNPSPCRSPATDCSTSRFRCRVAAATRSWIRNRSGKPCCSLAAAGQYIASPVIANGYMYLISSKGVLTIVKCGDKFEVVHQADLKASVEATPAMDANSLYLRTGDALLAFR